MICSGYELATIHGICHTDESHLDTGESLPIGSRTWQISFLQIWAPWLQDRNQSVDRSLEITYDLIFSAKDREIKAVSRTRREPFVEMGKRILIKNPPSRDRPWWRERMQPMLLHLKDRSFSVAWCSMNFLILLGKGRSEFVCVQPAWVTRSSLYEDAHSQRCWGKDLAPLEHIFISRRRTCLALWTASVRGGLKRSYLRSTNGCMQSHNEMRQVQSS